MIKFFKKNRKALEWIIPLGIFGLLYVSGYWPEVAGSIQSLVVKSNIKTPDLESGNNEPLPLNFELECPNGTIEHGASKAEKVLFVNLWATWCPPCIAELPDINDLYLTYRDDPEIEFLMINLDRDREKAIRFLARKAYDFPTFFPASPMPDVLNVRSIPTTYVVGKDGKIKMEHRGLASYNNQAFKNFIEELKESGNS